MNPLSDFRRPPQNAFHLMDPCPFHFICTQIWRDYLSLHLGARPRIPLHWCHIVSNEQKYTEPWVSLWSQRDSPWHRVKPKIPHSLLSERGGNWLLDHTHHSLMALMFLKPSHSRWDSLFTCFFVRDEKLRVQGKTAANIHRCFFFSQL